MDGRLDAALEDCRSRLARGESIEQCLAAHPAQAAELRTLLPLLAALRALRREPEAAYAHEARRRFHASLAAVQAAESERARSARPSGPLRWLRRLAIPLAAVAALATSGVGLVTASADALPGSPLYPVQQAQEQVSAHLARSPAQQAVYQLGLANRRLIQVRQAERRKLPPLVIENLTTAMVQATSRAAQDLEQVPEPQRQKILVRAAPLLVQEERVIAREQAHAGRGGTPAAERRQQQLRAAAARLQAEQAAATPGSAPSHTGVASSVVAATTAARRASVIPRSGPSPSPAVSPRPTAANPSPSGHTAGTPGTPAERLRRILGKWRERSSQPVHTPTP